MSQHTDTPASPSLAEDTSSMTQKDNCATEGLSGTLSPEHIAMLGERRISIGVARAAGLTSVSQATIDRHGARLKAKFGFVPPCSGLAIPYQGTLDGVQRWRFRCDKLAAQTGDDGADGLATSHAIPRYMATPGASVIPYTPHLGQVILHDPTQTLYVVEAPLKALTLTSAGFPAVGLGGVHAGLHDPLESSKAGKLVMNGPASEIAWSGRPVTIVFDAGIRTNAKVALGAAVSAQLLRDAGASVDLAFVPMAPGGQDRGPDDYICGNSIEAFQALVDARVPASPLLRAKLAVTAEEADALLREYFFLASLSLGGTPVQDAVAAGWKKLGLSKKAVTECVKKFDAALATKRLDHEDSQYLIDDDGFLCVIAPSPQGPLPKRIANFDARLTGVTVSDDGSGDTTVSYMVEGERGGSKLPPIEVPAAKFADLAWTLTSPGWAGKAVLEPGKGVADTVRHAIQVRSGSVPTSTHFTHTGWREVEGKEAYLHAGGAIGSEGVKVKLTGDKMARFDLSTPCSEVAAREAMRGSLGLLSVAGEGGRATMTALLSLVYLAPLASLLRPRFLAALIGPSGSMKTTIAIELQRHFGPGFRSDGDLPLNFTSTPTAVENGLFSAKDALCVIDDYFPRRSSKDAESQDKLASLIARSVGNGQGRERSRADLTQRASRPPRAVALLTAEVDPVPASNDESAANRALKLHIRAGQVDKVRLSALQASPHHLAMRSYLEALASSWADTGARVTARHAELIAELRREEGLQARQADQLAALLTAWRLLQDHAVRVGLATPSEAAASCALAREDLLSLARTQTETSAALAPEAAYLEVLRSLVTQGRAELVDKSQRLTASDGRGIGWRSDKFVWLLPAAVHEAVVSASRASGQHIPLKISDIFDRWVQRGWATPRATGSAHIGVQRSLGGGRPRVIELDATLLGGVPLLATDGPLAASVQGALDLGLGLDAPAEPAQPSEPSDMDAAVEAIMGAKDTPAPEDPAPSPSSSPSIPPSGPLNLPEATVLALPIAPETETEGVYARVARVDIDTQAGAIRADYVTETGCHAEATYPLAPAVTEALWRLWDTGTGLRVRVSHGVRACGEMVAWAFPLEEAAQVV